jgi:hypothetical protein
MSRIERVTNLAMIVVCCALTAELVARRFAPSVPLPARSASGVAPRPESYKAGDEFPAVPGLSADAQRRSVILFVRDGCRYCENSIPFYRRLAQAVQNQQATVRLVGLCPDRTEACATYLKANGIQVSDVVGVQQQQGTLKFAGTPTLLLMDPSRKIASVWIGQLSAAAENEVLEAISGKDIASPRSSN